MKFLVAITALLVVVMGALLFVVNSDGAVIRQMFTKGLHQLMSNRHTGMKMRQFLSLSLETTNVRHVELGTAKYSRNFKQTISTLVTFLIPM